MAGLFCHQAGSFADSRQNICTGLVFQTLQLYHHTANISGYVVGRQMIQGVGDNIGSALLAGAAAAGLHNVVHVSKNNVFHQVVNFYAHLLFSLSSNSSGLLWAGICLKLYSL